MKTGYIIDYFEANFKFVKVRALKREKIAGKAIRPQDPKASKAFIGASASNL